MSTSAPPSARNSSIAPRSASASTLRSIRMTARISRSCPRPSATAWSPAPRSSRVCSTASPCAATQRSQAGPPRSISGRSRITPVSLLEIIKDTTEYEAAAASSQRSLILGTVAILIGAILLALLLGRGLSRPLAAITAVMNRLSGGEIDVTIPGAERRDELGTMASAVDVFRRSMIDARSMREAQEASKHQTELEKKALQRQMADRFETDVDRKSVV